MTDPYLNYEAIKGWEEARFGQPTKPDSLYFDKEVGPWLTPGAQVLEIGYGNALFMGWCRARGLAVEGTELNEELLRRGRAHGFTVTNDLEALRVQGRQYDVIVAMEVMEHIDKASFVAVLDTIRQLCRPGGHFIFKVPNGDNPFSLYLQNGDITHVIHIGSTLIRSTAQQAGFDVVRIGCPATPFRGMPLKRQISLLIGTPLRQMCGRFFSLVMMGGYKTSFAPNLVAVLARPADSPRR
jgi:2-polyprenyl-3-methyl-5-hydroxy-6-metoxy-1,4-benzoquinol methylase